MRTTKPIERTMQYVRRKRIVRPRDLEALGIPREYLLRLHRQGKLNRTGRGIYILPDATVTERHSYAEVARRVPEAVLCLLSALAFHELTTQRPAAVWIAIGKGARKPAVLSPSLRVVRLTGPWLSEGVEKHTVEGTRIKEEDEYEGVRVKFHADVAGARIPMQVDIGFGDVVSPEPEFASFPVLLPIELSVIHCGKDRFVRVIPGVGVPDSEAIHACTLAAGEQSKPNQIVLLYYSLNGTKHWTEHLDWLGNQLRCEL